MDRHKGLHVEQAGEEGEGLAQLSQDGRDRGHGGGGRGDRTSRLTQCNFAEIYFNV